MASAGLDDMVKSRGAQAEHHRRQIAAWRAKSDAARELHDLKVVHRNRVRLAAMYTGRQAELRAEYLADARAIRRAMRPWRRRARKERCS